MAGCISWNNTSWYPDEFFQYMCILTNTHTHTTLDLCFIPLLHFLYILNVKAYRVVMLTLTGDASSDMQCNGFAWKQSCLDYYFSSVIQTSSKAVSVIMGSRQRQQVDTVVTYIGCHFPCWLIRGLRHSGRKFKVLLGSVLCVFCI